MARYLSEETRIYASQLLGEVFEHAEIEGQEAFLAESFTDLILDDLEEEGIWPDYQLSYFSQRGIEVSAWGVDEVNRALHLCVTDFVHTDDALSLTNTEIQAIQKRLTNFFSRARRGQVEAQDHNPIVDLVGTIQDGEAYDTIRFSIVSNRIVSTSTEQKFDLDAHPATVRVWDLESIRRSRQTGQWLQPIEVDFVARTGTGIPCLRSPHEIHEVDTYLVFMPGSVLASIYIQYGPRLLERNVRSFLMARGKINQGIRDTLRLEPERFLAYNNGITATASKVDTRRGADGTLEVVRINDLQIVNGGQTTASIANAAQDPGTDLGAVFVQMKLAVVDPYLLDELVPNISRFANRQNAVQESDLAANHEYLRNLQTVSRTEWTPAAAHGRPSKWYFERARGSYAVEKSSAGSPTQQAAFAAEYPPAQKFGKNEVALYENTWSRLPHIVCRGGQKSFAEFISRLPEVTGSDEDVQASYRSAFRNLAGKAILFKAMDKGVRAELGGTYKRQVVAYSLSYFLERHRDKVDLAMIWRTQQVDAAIMTALMQIAESVKDSIIATGFGKNITEWTKQEACWVTINALDLEYEPPAKLLVQERPEQPPPLPRTSAVSSHALKPSRIPRPRRNQTLAQAIDSVFGEPIDGQWRRFRRPKWHHVCDTGVPVPSNQGTYHIFSADFKHSDGRPYSLDVAVDFPSRDIVPVADLPSYVRELIEEQLNKND